MQDSRRLGEHGPPYTFDNRSRSGTCLESVDLGIGVRASKDGAALTGWAEITNLTTHTSAAALAIIGCALALFGGLVLAMNPGKDSAKKNRYERKQERSQKIRKDLEDAPDSGRVLWDAIDADIDPTTDKGRG